MGYQDVNIASILDLIEKHSRDHPANLTLHLLFGVDVVSIAVPKTTPQAADEYSFESYYAFIYIGASLGKGFSWSIRLLIMIPRHIIEGHVQAIQQIFQIIRRQVPTSEDQSDSVAFFSEKVFLEKRLFDCVANGENSHYYQLLSDQQTTSTGKEH